MTTRPRESFYDTRKSPLSYDQDRLRRRMRLRPFWLNIKRQFWHYRMPFFDGKHWRTLADGERTTARYVYFAFSRCRRPWMPQMVRRWYRSNRAVKP